MSNLTARSPKNGMAYLVNIKPNDQGLEGSYDVLQCVRAAFEKLAVYEEVVPEMDKALSEILTLVALIDAPLDKSILSIITLCERALGKADGILKCPAHL